VCADDSWDNTEARALIGTELEYSAEIFRWQKVVIGNPVAQVTTVTGEEFRDETSGRGRDSSQVDFRQLGMSQKQALQIVIRHSGADVFKATSGIPGDSVLLKSGDTIVFSVCGVYFEARRSVTPKGK
jgi:hypothetical protein